MGNAEKPSSRQPPMREDADVDAYAVPIHAFGETPPSEFFEILGRILAVNGQIEYLQDRLDHLPASETSDVRKVEQFLTRCVTGRADRNAVVHSRWVFGANVTDRDAIVGLRYKIRNRTAGDAPSVSLSDIQGGERAQDVVQHTLKSLKTLLRRDVITMRIGELAYSAVMLRWGAKQIPTVVADSPTATTAMTPPT